MGSVPTARTFVAGEIETAAFMNSLGSAVTFLLNPPRCSVYMGTTGLALTTGVAAMATFDTEAYDTDNMHSTSSNTSRLTAQTPGLYRFTGQYNFGSNATGTRQIALFKNGAAQGYVAGAGLSAQSALLEITKEIQMAAGDYVELQVTQNSGGTITAPVGVPYCWFQALWTAAS